MGMYDAQSFPNLPGFSFSHGAKSRAIRELPLKGRMLAVAQTIIRLSSVTPLLPTTRSGSPGRHTYRCQGGLRVRHSHQFR